MTDAQQTMAAFKGMDAEAKIEALMNLQMEQMLNKSNGNYDVIALYNIYKTYNSLDKEIMCILDSGAGVHLSKYAQNLDRDTQSRIMVAGSNGSTETTNGVGGLPCTFTDALTGDVFAFSFMGVHGHNGVKTLISLGLLLRAGSTLEARPADDILLFTPPHTHCIAVMLGDDNILHFTCTNRLPSACTTNLAQGRAAHHRAERPYCPMGGVCCVGTPESTSVPPRLARVGGGNCQHARKAV